VFHHQPSHPLSESSGLAPSTIVERLVEPAVHDRGQRVVGTDQRTSGILGAEDHRSRARVKDDTHLKEPRIFDVLRWRRMSEAYLLRNDAPSGAVAGQL
jgi:hypothetical protein